MEGGREMSECTTCTYYGKHLEGRAELMPWPCVECAGGEKYVERGKRKHQVPLRAQLATLLTRHTALVEAVAWERECVFAFADDDWSFWFDDCARDELVVTVNAACDFTDALVVEG